MRETAALIGDVDEAGWSSIREIVSLVGAASVESLRHVVMVETETTRFDARVRGSDRRVSRAGRLDGLRRWSTTRAGSSSAWRRASLGRDRDAGSRPFRSSAAARQRPRVARDAVAALGAIDDPPAARAIHTVLRTATGDRRPRSSKRCVADRDPRVVPMLAASSTKASRSGRDHDIVLDDGDGAGHASGSEQAVFPRWPRWSCGAAFLADRKLRALKEAWRGRPEADRRPAAMTAMRRCEQPDGRPHAQEDRRAAERIDGYQTSPKNLSGGSPPALRGTEAVRAEPSARAGAWHRRSRPRRLPKALQAAPSVVVGFIGDEVVVNASASAAWIARRSWDSLATCASADIEKDHVDARAHARRSAQPHRTPSSDRAVAGAGRGPPEQPRASVSVTLGRVVVEEVTDDQAGIAARAGVYWHGGRDGRRTLWNAAKAGDQPDPGAARKIIDGLARARRRRIARR